MFNIILSLGIIILFGILSAKLSNKLTLPSVTGYIATGVVIGPYVLNFIHGDILNASSLISSIALSFIAFGLGQNFTISQFKRIGKSVLFISIGEVIGAFLLVSLALYFVVKTPLYLSIVLGAIAPATAPAAVVLVVREYAKKRGVFSNTLLSVVAIDDAWGIILFAFSLAVARSLTGVTTSFFSTIIKDIFHAFYEVLGSLFLGLCVGIVFSYSLKFIRTPSRLLSFDIGFILLTGGIAVHLNLSILLSNMMLGATIANLSKDREKIFSILSGFDPPIYILFFVLAGASLELGNLRELGLVGIVYVFTRLPGEMIGAFIGALISKADKTVRKYIGLGLAPQAGVAIGLALLSKAYLPPDAGKLILGTIIVTTVIYELIGPPLVKLALHKAGEVV